MYARVAEPPVCPDCGDHLRPVATKTLKHLLRYPLARRLEEGVFFHCENPDCDVVYVRGTDLETAAETAAETATEPAEVFRRADIKERALPFATGSERLVCHCFGYTVGEIEHDARTGRDAIPAAINAEVRAGHCACEVMNPKGG